MKKMFITVAVAGVVGFGSTLFGSTANADELSDIEDQRSDVKDDLSDADEEIADVLIDLEEINDQIARVEDTLKENKKKKKDTKEKIGKTNDEIDDLEDEIEILENDIDNRYEILKERAMSYQKNGGDVGFMEVVLGSDDFSEFVSRVSAVTKITDSDEELMEKQEADKAEVEEKQTESEDKLADLEDMETELEGMEETILAQKDEKESNKKDLKKKEKELNETKEDLEIEDSELASLQTDVRESIEAAEEEQATAEASSDSDGDLTTLSDDDSSNDDSSNDASSDNDVSGDGDVDTVISAGDKFIGNSTYGLGSKDPENGRFDCSGFVSWSYDQAGYDLPRNTDGLASTGSKVDPSDMEPGDLVFFDTYKKNGHVGIYMGDNEFIGSQTSTGVDVADMDNSYWKKNFDGHVRRVD